MGGRGRPIKSQIRSNVAEILYFLKSGYGYDIYRIYKALFPAVTIRSVYYHLRKGCDLGEFKIDRVEKAKGDFSWGSEAEKIYYSLGPNANALGNERVKTFLEKYLNK